jgi:hypothetical protein
MINLLGFRVISYAYVIHINQGLGGVALTSSKFSILKIYCKEPLWLAHHKQFLKLWRLPNIETSTPNIETYTSQFLIFFFNFAM